VVCHALSKLLAPCQKFSLKLLAGAFPRGFHQRSENGRNKKRIGKDKRNSVFFDSLAATR